MFETEDLKAAHLKYEDSESTSMCCGSLSPGFQDTRGRLLGVGIGYNRRADCQKSAKIGVILFIYLLENLMMFMSFSVKFCLAGHY